jgi:hypothetical protein
VPGREDLQLLQQQIWLTLLQVTLLNHHAWLYGIELELCLRVCLQNPTAAMFKSVCGAVGLGGPPSVPTADLAVIAACNFITSVIVNIDPAFGLPCRTQMQLFLKVSVVVWGREGLQLLPQQI